MRPEPCDGRPRQLLRAHLVAGPSRIQGIKRGADIEGVGTLLRDITPQDPSRPGLSALHRIDRHSSETANFGRSILRAEIYDAMVYRTSLSGAQNALGKWSN